VESVYKIGGDMLENGAVALKVMMSTLDRRGKIDRDVKGGDVDGGLGGLGAKDMGGRWVNNSRLRRGTG